MKWRWVFWGSVTFVAGSFCLGAGMFLPLLTVFYLAFGWLLYLPFVVLHVQVDWPTVGMAAGLLAGFTVGLHYTLRWFAAAVTNRKPIDSAPPEQVAEDDRAPSSESLTFHWRKAWTVAIVAVTLFAFVAGTSVVGIAHQVVWLATSEESLLTPGRSDVLDRSRASMSLRLTGLGLNEYAEQHDGNLPAGTIADADGRLLHGWMVQILPYVEGGRGLAVFDTARMDLPWDDPANRELYQTHVVAFESPTYWLDRKFVSTDEHGYQLTGMAANALLMGGTEPVKLQHVTDGAAHTIFAGEVIRSPRPWGHPANWEDPREGINQPAGGFSAIWSNNSAQFLMLDGSVRAIAADVDPEVLEALATPAAGDNPGNAR